MKTQFFCGVLIIIILSACKKTESVVNIPSSTNSDKNIQIPTSSPFVDYLIPKNEHYCIQSSFVSVSYSELKFVVSFDSSAIYQSKAQCNQLDINKLYGFSDNGADHHQFSARFGWRWNDNALQMFAYIYNNGKVDSSGMGAIKIGDEYICKIKVTPANYIFSINSLVDSMPRKSTTVLGTGYKLYPYFGGDETAPHDVHIRIREL